MTKRGFARIRKQISFFPQAPDAAEKTSCKDLISLKTNNEQRHQTATPTEKDGRTQAQNGVWKPVKSTWVEGILRGCLIKEEHSSAAVSTGWVLSCGNVVNQLDTLT
ncbi:hypothetical protein KIL84_016966 [Mauremys mutica]|uniref:Uncharacterized protein n=1 Tax=Mauremys mutica TaxID=74926 RepID=A0A9D4AR82_9SAUR|nr:hypothetical protein KIL84_016966 [Mauremys mutica]